MSACGTRPRPAQLFLAAAVLASGGLLLLLGSRLTFLLDDWEFLLYRRGFSAHVFLDPHGPHISILPVAIYKALQATVGMGSAFPFRVVSTLLFLIGAVLPFVLLARRVGDWLALIGTVLVLFLGAAYEDLLWSFQIGFFGSIACGLGMLLALERGDRRGDRIACALLALSITFSSLGLPFMAGAAAELGRRREGWRRREYVVLLPAALYAVWWLGWGHTAHSDASLHNLAVLPIYVLNAISAGLLALAGLDGNASAAAPGLGWGQPLCVAALAAAGWRLTRLGRVPPELWVMVAIALAFWLLAGLNVTLGRGPASSRYQLPSAIFLLLIAAELLRGVRIRAPALIAIALLAAAALAGSISTLKAGYAGFKVNGEEERAALGAIEIARNTVSPSFVPSESISGTPDVSVFASAYLSAADKFGSPAYSPAEIAAAPEAARQAADRVLGRALPISTEPISRPPARRGPAPTVLNPQAGTGAARGGCVTVDPGTLRSPPVLALPPGGAVLSVAPGGSAQIRLRRFATASFPLQPARLRGGAPTILKIPTDRSSVPWQAETTSSGRLTACAR